MTRDTVTVGDTTVADVFHDHDADEPHMTVTLGDDAEFSFDSDTGDDYVDAEIDGHETDIDEYNWTDDRHLKRRTFEVQQNGETVATGLLSQVTAAAVTLTVAGNGEIVLPTNQRVTINVRGEPAD